MMSNENQQITRMQDSITLRPAPVVRKPRAQIINTVIDSAPLTILEVKTVKGEIRYKMQARTRKYCDKNELGRLIAKTMRYLYPRHDVKNPQRARRYYLKHKAEHLERQRLRRQRMKEQKQV